MNIRCQIWEFSKFKVNFLGLIHVLDNYTTSALNPKTLIVVDAHLCFFRYTNLLGVVQVFFGFVIVELLVITGVLVAGLSNFESITLV